MLWNYTVPGEAAAQLPAAFKASHPEVRWVQPARVRNRIVHGYFDIALSILHTAAANDLPSLSEHLATLIAELEQEA